MRGKPLYELICQLFDTSLADCRCGLGGWRNGLRFDPFKKYGDWSYVDIMLDPLVNALRSSMTADTKVRSSRSIV